MTQQRKFSTVNDLYYAVFYEYLYDLGVIVRQKS